MATTQNEKETMWISLLLGSIIAILIWLLGCIFYDYFTNSIGFARICNLLVALVSVLGAVFTFLGIDKPVRQSRVKSLLLSIAF